MLKQCILIQCMLMILVNMPPICSTEVSMGENATATADVDAEILAYARQRSEQCDDPDCMGAVVMGFANMGYMLFCGVSSARV